MAERIIVKQDRQFHTQFLAADPEDIHSNVFDTIEDIHKLTPYGMLLCSLASCTALVLHTFAQNHDLKLREVEIHSSYKRVFREDCEDCEKEQEFNEEIEERIMLEGDLNQTEREKLLRIAHFCPISKIIEGGCSIKCSLIEGKVEDEQEG
jgi:uncharacterized OsmC-like protein